jgi:hypothetical protein
MILTLGYTGTPFPALTRLLHTRQAVLCDIRYRLSRGTLCIDRRPCRTPSERATCMSLR